MSTRLYIFFLIFLSISNVFSQSFENISLINNNITSYPFNESNAYLSIDGNSLFFNSSDNINNTGGLNDMNDIWYRNRNNGLWEPPINLTQVNTNENDIILGLNNDILIVLRNRLINYYDINNQFKLLGREEIDGFSTNYNLLTGSINKKSDIIFLSLEGYGTYGVEDIPITNNMGFIPGRVGGNRQAPQELTIQTVSLLNLGAILIASAKA